ncbi:MAG: transketolase [Eubacteriales bacterium]|jgi:transketolase
MTKSTEQINIIKNLQIKSAEIRHMLVDVASASGYAHIGGPLSSCDILTALYFHFMNFSYANKDNMDRDRFVLSKGHAGDVLYCVLASLGFYSKEELIKEFKKYQGRWGEHPNRMHNPGIEVSTGSLGHGLSIALGMAMAGWLDRSARRIYCLVGDGELQEGSNWEAIMCAGHQQFDNLVLIVDQNGAQGTRRVKEIIASDNLDERISAFGWDLRHVEDGNNMVQLFDALSALPPVENKRRRPVCLLLHTVKGCGVDFMENDIANCHAYGFNSEKQEVAHCSIDRKLEADLAYFD